MGTLLKWAISTKFMLFLGKSIQCSSTEIFMKYSLNTSLARETTESFNDFSRDFFALYILHSVIVD